MRRKYSIKVKLKQVESKKIPYPLLLIKYLDGNLNKI